MLLWSYEPHWSTCQLYSTHDPFSLRADSHFKPSQIHPHQIDSVHAVSSKEVLPTLLQSLYYHMPTSYLLWLLPGVQDISWEQIHRRGDTFKIYHQRGFVYSHPETRD